MGLKVIQNNGFSIIIDQDAYVDSIVEIKVDKSQKVGKDALLTKQELREFHSIIGRLNWIVNHSRPDILFDLRQLSSIVKPATVRDLLFASKLVSKIKSDRTVLRFNKLELSNLQLICYNDLSFVSGGSQGGFIIYISDSTGFAAPIMCSSHKSKCVVKSAMAAETLFQVDGAESTFWLKMIYQELFHVDMVKTIIPIICCTNSRYYLWY